MNVLFRNNKEYIARRGGHFFDSIKPAVELWNNTFTIDYFSFRKKLRRLSIDVLKNSMPPISNIYICLDWNKIWDFERWEDQIFAPMDDDDVFILSEEEYESVLGDLEDHDGVILGYYDGWIDKNGCFGYTKNRINSGGPMGKIEPHKQIHSNNFIYKHRHETLDASKLPIFHVAAGGLDLRYKQRRDIESSLHFMHPCSVYILQGMICKEDLIQYCEGFIHRHKVPNKFHHYVEKFQNAYYELKRQ